MLGEWRDAPLEDLLEKTGLTLYLLGPQRRGVLVDWHDWGLARLGTGRHTEYEYREFERGLASPGGAGGAGGAGFNCWGREIDLPNRALANLQGREGRGSTVPAWARANVYQRVFSGFGFL